jgi:hypothetical protein
MKQVNEKWKMRNGKSSLLNLNHTNELQIALQSDGTDFQGCIFHFSFDIFHLSFGDRNLNEKWKMRNGKSFL